MCPTHAQGCSCLTSRGAYALSIFGPDKGELVGSPPPQIFSTGEGPNKGGPLQFFQRDYTTEVRTLAVVAIHNNIQYLFN